jgi:hypothetical protein
MLLNTTIQLWDYCHFDLGYQVPSLDNVRVQFLIQHAEGKKVVCLYYYLTSIDFN